MNAVLIWFLKGGWRTMFIFAAFGFGMTAIYTMSLKKDYVFVVEQLASDKKLHKAELGLREVVIDSYKTQETLWTTIANERKTAMEAARREVTRARESEKAARAQAAASHTAFQSAFNNRSSDCEDALMQLEAMCPTLSSY